jgi:hypothetical protein
MIIKKTDTDFDQLINTAKHKISLNSAHNLKFHRQHSRPDLASLGAHLPLDAPLKPFSANFTHLFKHPDANDSHELADTKFIIQPLPADPNPSPSNKQLESLGNKRWKYQGKTYKEEPIGKS